MELQLKTKAEGVYTFYTPNDNGEMTLINETKNIITGAGLEFVRSYPWSECFTWVRLGSAASPAAATLSVSALTQQCYVTDTYYANPQVGTYAFGDFTNSITYAMHRAWRFNNTTGNDLIITEVGASPKETSSLFSYTPLTNTVVVSANRAIIVQYELRLTTTSVFSGSNLQFYTGTGAAPGWQIPNNYHGVISCPFQLIRDGGLNTSLPGSLYSCISSAGGALFEPQTQQYYASFINTSVPSISCQTSFLSARSVFQTISSNGPLAEFCPNLSVYASNIVPLGNSPHSMTMDPETIGVPKRSWRITVSPVPGQLYNGLIINTISPAAPGSITYPGPTGPVTVTNYKAHSTTGWHIVFENPWTRPNNTYLELAVAHEWS
jgi:hypothetical protein